MKPIINFFSDVKDIEGSLVANVGDYWRTIIDKNILDKKYCPSNTELWWIGKTGIETGVCFDSVEKSLSKKAGSVSFMPCERYSEFSFIVTGGLNNRVLAWEIDGSNYWQYYGLTDSIEDYITHLEEQTEVVRVKRKGNKITLLLCKDLCGQSIKAYEGFNPNKLELVRIKSSCEQITCCCSQWYWLDVCFPNELGCYWLGIIDSKTKEILAISQSFTVKDGIENEYTLVQFRDDRNLFGWGLSGQMSQLRLPLSISRAGRTITEKISTKNNGNHERESVIIQHNWEFSTQSLDSESHDFILEVLKHKEVYMKKPNQEEFMKVFYAGGYNESGFVSDSSVASGLLLQVGENINDITCLVACSSRDSVNIKIDNNDILDVSTYLYNLENEETHILEGDTTLKIGNYELSLGNFELRDIEISILENDKEVKIVEVKANRKCKISLCLKECKEMKISIKPKKC